MCGAVLGIGSTGLMIGLTWLVNSYGYTGEPLKLVNLVNLVSAVVSAIVALMVMVSAQGYAKAVLYPSACRDPVTRRHIRPDQRGYARRDLSLDQTHPQSPRCCAMGHPQFRLVRAHQRTHGKRGGAISGRGPEVHPELAGALRG